MAERVIIEIIQRYIRTLEEHGILVSFVVLFGSQARGNTHKWSDIDLRWCRRFLMAQGNGKTGCG